MLLKHIPSSDVDSVEIKFHFDHVDKMIHSLSKVRALSIKASIQARNAAILKFTVLMHCCFDFALSGSKTGSDTGLEADWLGHRLGSRLARMRAPFNRHHHRYRTSAHQHPGCQDH